MSSKTNLETLEVNKTKKSKTFMLYRYRLTLCEKRGSYFSL